MKIQNLGECGISTMLASWKWGGAGDGQSLASGSMNGFDSVKNLDPVAELRGEEMDEPWNAASQPSVIGGTRVAIENHGAARRSAPSRSSLAGHGVRDDYL